MNDRGFFLTQQAVRRQLTAMPCELYLIRLVHQETRRAFPGERLWSAVQLLHPATLRFLRARNCEGCDVFLQPFAGQQNAGYILVDLDHADATVLTSMRGNGHDPCVVLQTSPGHYQAWVHLSCSPLPPALASAVGKSLAHTYGGDLASTDWRHLGRLAGFTNQKPQRRTGSGYAPWVRILHARAGLAPNAQTLIESALQGPTAAALPTRISCDEPPAGTLGPDATPPQLTTAEAAQLYRECIQRWHILERFPQPDWSIVDLWVVRELLRQGRTVAEIAAVIRLASPDFPRAHSNPEDYLRRTIARAGFPAPEGAMCVLRIPLPLPAADTQQCLTADAPLPTLHRPSRGQSLILADQVLNCLAGYARKGTRARRDFYQRDLNWLADVWLRVQAGEPHPLRPTGQ